MAYFLGKLKATPDGDGNLLDHSLILYGSGMSNSNVHNHAPLPVFVAGGAAGRMKGGRHLKYPEGTPMANLLLTILDKAGVAAGARWRQHRDVDRAVIGGSTGKQVRRHFAFCCCPVLRPSPRAARWPTRFRSVTSPLCRRLLKQHAAVNTAQPDGTTALHWAAHWNDAETVESAAPGRRGCEGGESIRRDSAFRGRGRWAMPRSSNSC